ncbi:MAG: hypothetical protein HYX38_35040 [Rhodospirillales bacterium]|nr:hypothetical protein [Rhodospirillales bacterium]
MATVARTTVPGATMKAAMVEPMKVVEMPETMGQENRTADKIRPIEPGIPVWLGGLIQIDGLRRQCVDQFRQAGRILRDPPLAIGLLAHQPDGLLRLSSNRHLGGELSAILRYALRRTLGHLRQGGRRGQRGRRVLPRASRQDQHYGDTEKGARISISHDRP